MTSQERISMLKETFDAVSGGYDHKALRFFPYSAARLASFLSLRGDEHVLDVAAGTGNAALSIAGRLPNGRVTGIDFSAGMLAQARRKAAALGLRNVDFVEREMQNIGFPDGHFDAAVCAFGIFFVDDMDAQLSHIASAVRPGGMVAITSFREDYFSPLKEMFFERIAEYGVQKPPQTWRRIADAAGCAQLFAAAGLADIRVEHADVGYNLDSADEWWDIIWNAGLRRMVSGLPPEQMERFRLEHLREIDALKTGDGIRLNVDVLYTIGTKPE